MEFARSFLKEWEARHGTADFRISWRETMTTKLNKGPNQSDSVARLIEATVNALIKLITIGTSTLVALGILVILGAIILRATPEVQQQIVPLLTGMLGVIIGRLLTQGEPSPSKPPEKPGTPE
jgi:hypothetical protein